MFDKLWRFRSVFAGLVIASLCLVPPAAVSQDLVGFSSLTGSGSVFVFRSGSRTVKRAAPTAKPTRSKDRRMASVTKLKKQYETMAKTTPKAGRVKAATGPKPPPPSMPPLQAAKVFTGVGEYFIQKGELDNAIDKFRDALSLDPSLAAAKLGLGESLSLKGNDLLEKELFAEAKPLFEEALTNDPKNAAAYFGLGEVYSELDRSGEAIANFEKALENDKSLTEIYAPLGILYFQAGEIAKADDLLTKAIALTPNEAETQYFLGLVRQSQNRQNEALTALEKATTLDPNYADAWNTLGDTLVALKRSGDAVPAYQKAVALKDRSFDAWLGLGGALYDADKYAEALTALMTAKKLKNDSWEVYGGLGDANLKLGNFNDAAANFNLAATFLTRQKDFNKDTAADIYSKVGYAIGQQCPINTAKFQPCQWGSAIKALEKAVELGNKPIDQTNLGWAYFNASRVDRDNKDKAAQEAKLALAKEKLLTAAAANPAFIDSIRQNLGAVMLDQGDYRGAIDNLTSVVAHQPDWVFSKYALGSAYFLSGDYDGAEKAFRAAVEKDPNYVDALYSLGIVYVRRKNGKEAGRILNELKKRDPGAAARLEQEIRLGKIK
jgi:tetratricopeptide (TPR) repeat protein